MRLDISFKDVRQCLRFTLGLAIYACGTYALVKTDLGLAPWEIFAMGISFHTPISFGQSIIAISIVIVIIDIILKGTIGVGIIIDTLLVGTFVDIVTMIDFLPDLSGLPIRIGVYLAGITVMSFGMFLTLTAAQGVGPRDTLMIVIGKRFPRVPIGAVQSGLLLFAFTMGLLLGGPVGIGTIISVTCMGPLLQVWCHLFRFEPRNVVHKSLLDYFRDPGKRGDPGERRDAEERSDPKERSDPDLKA